MRVAEIAHYQSEAHDLWLGRRPDGSLVLEGFLKTDGQLKHLVCTPPDAMLRTATELVLDYGRVVQRPYRLAQACDGSIATPVFALFLDFCARHGLDAQAIYDEAYPGDTVLEPQATLDFAHWQGVRLPHTWTAACFAGLLASLTEINCALLRSTLEEAACTISFPGGVLEREGYVAFRDDTRCYGPTARFTWGHVITPTGEQVWQYDPWQSTNGAVPTHYWLSFLAVAAGRDGNPLLARRLIEEAERSARSPANKQHYRGWLESLQAAA